MEPLLDAARQQGDCRVDSAMNTRSCAANCAANCAALRPPQETQLQLNCSHGTAAEQLLQSAGLAMGPAWPELSSHHVVCQDSVMVLLDGAMASALHEQLQRIYQQAEHVRDQATKILPAMNGLFLLPGFTSAITVQASDTHSMPNAAIALYGRSCEATRHLEVAQSRKALCDVVQLAAKVGVIPSCHHQHQHQHQHHHHHHHHHHHPVAADELLSLLESDSLLQPIAIVQILDRLLVAAGSWALSDRQAQGLMAYCSKLINRPGRPGLEPLATVALLLTASKYSNLAAVHFTDPLAAESWIEAGMFRGPFAKAAAVMALMFAWKLTSNKSRIATMVGDTLRFDLLMKQHGFATKSLELTMQLMLSCDTSGDSAAKQQLAAVVVRRPSVLRQLVYILLDYALPADAEAAVSDAARRQAEAVRGLLKHVVGSCPESDSQLLQQNLRLHARQWCCRFNLDAAQLTLDALAVVKQVTNREQPVGSRQQQQQQQQPQQQQPLPSTAVQVVPHPSNPAISPANCNVQHQATATRIAAVNSPAINTPAWTGKVPPPPAPPPPPLLPRHCGTTGAGAAVTTTPSLTTRVKGGVPPPQTTHPPPRRAGPPPQLSPAAAAAAANSRPGRAIVDTVVFQPQQHPTTQRGATSFASVAPPQSAALQQAGKPPRRQQHGGAATTAAPRGRSGCPGPAAPLQLLPSELADAAAIAASAEVFQKQQQRHPGTCTYMTKAGRKTVAAGPPGLPDNAASRSKPTMTARHVPQPSAALQVAVLSSAATKTALSCEAAAAAVAHEVDILGVLNQINNAQRSLSSRVKAAEGLLLCSKQELKAAAASPKLISGLRLLWDASKPGACLVAAKLFGLLAQHKIGQATWYSPEGLVSQLLDALTGPHAAAAANPDLVTAAATALQHVICHSQQAYQHVQTHFTNSSFAPGNASPLATLVAGSGTGDAQGRSLLGLLHMLLNLGKAAIMAELARVACQEFGQLVAALPEPQLLEMLPVAQGGEAAKSGAVAVAVSQLLQMVAWVQVHGNQDLWERAVAGPGLVDKLGKWARYEQREAAHAAAGVLAALLSWSLHEQVLVAPALLQQPETLAALISNLRDSAVDASADSRLVLCCLAQQVPAGFSTVMLQPDTTGKSLLQQLGGHLPETIRPTTLTPPASQVAALQVMDTMMCSCISDSLQEAVGTYLPGIISTLKNSNGQAYEASASIMLMLAAGVAGVQQQLERIPGIMMKLASMAGFIQNQQQQQQQQHPAVHNTRCWAVGELLPKQGDGWMALRRAVQVQRDRALGKPELGAAEA